MTSCWLRWRRFFRKVVRRGVAFEVVPGKTLCRRETHSEFSKRARDPLTPHRPWQLRRWLLCLHERMQSFVHLWKKRAWRRKNRSEGSRSEITEPTQNPFPTPFILERPLLPSFQIPLAAAWNSWASLRFDFWGSAFLSLSFYRTVSAIKNL